TRAPRARRQTAPARRVRRREDLALHRPAKRQAVEEIPRRLVGARPRHSAHVGELESPAAQRIDQHRIERLVVAAVAQLHWLAVARGDAEPVTPLLQPDYDGEQRRALVGQAILVAQRALTVGGLAEDAGLDKLLQPRRQNVARDTEIFLEVVEAA